MKAVPKVKATRADRKFTLPPSAAARMMEALRLADDAEVVALLLGHRLDDALDEESRRLQTAATLLARISRKILHIMDDLLNGRVTAKAA